MAAERSDRQDTFLGVLARCLLGMAVAIALGCFIGYGVLIMIGHETEMTRSQRYLDRSYAGRAGFVTQNLEYQQAADALRAYPGLRVLRTAEGKPLYWQDGQQVDPSALMDETFASAIEILFTGSAEALSGKEDVTETLIEDMLLYNIAVDPQGNVYYYIYYDANGFLCIVYDESGAFADNQNAIMLLEQWYVYFEYQELDA